MPAAARRPGRRAGVRVRGLGARGSRRSRGFTFPARRASSRSRKRGRFLSAKRLPPGRKRSRRRGGVCDYVGCRALPKKSGGSRFPRCGGGSRPHRRRDSVGVVASRFSRPGGIVPLRRKASPCVQPCQRSLPSNARPRLTWSGRIEESGLHFDKKTTYRLASGEPIRTLNLPVVAAIGRAPKLGDPGQLILWTPAASPSPRLRRVNAETQTRLDELMAKNTEGPGWRRGLLSMSPRPRLQSEGGRATNPFAPGATSRPCPCRGCDFVARVPPRVASGATSRPAPVGAAPRSAATRHGRFYRCVFAFGRSPKIALPTRTIVAPSSMAMG